MVAKVKALTLGSLAALHSAPECHFLHTVVRSKQTGSFTAEGWEGQGGGGAAETVGPPTRRRMQSGACDQPKSRSQPL